MMFLILATLLASPPNDYPECRAAVESGRRASLAVGVPDAADFRTPTLDGIAPGVYDCYTLDGKQVMTLRAVVKAIPLAVQQPASHVPSGGLAQSKADIQARAGRCYHPGGSFGGGTKEGCGFSTRSADDAVRHCCFWGVATPIDIGVAKGSSGWHATVIYR